MADDQDNCTHCGAPRVTGFAACKFCKTPFVRNTQSGAIPCPKCNTLNELGAQRCVQCQTWVVVQCVFCSSLSPHHLPACQKCGEAFAGAPERFQQRQQAVSSQRNMQVIGTVGTVAASLLGGFAGAAIGGRSYGHGHHHQHHGYDNDGGFGHRNDGSWDQPIAQDNSQDNGGSGGGIMDSLFGGSSDSNDSGGATQSWGNDESSSSSSDDGGSGGGIMDSLFSGSDDS